MRRLNILSLVSYDLKDSFEDILSPLLRKKDESHVTIYNYLL